MRKLIAIVTLSVIFLQVNSQTDPETVITATGTFVGTIKEKPQRIKHIAEQLDSVAPAPKFNHGVSPKLYHTQFEVEPIAAAKVEGEPVKKLTRGYVKAGLGNYGMFLGDVFYGSVRSKKGSYSARYNHFSSSSGVQDVQGFSGFSQNRFLLDGKKFYKKHTLFGDLEYDRDVVHFYGSSTGNDSLTKDFLKQRYRYVGFGTRLQSHLADSSKINHDIALSYYHLDDRYASAENNFKAAGMLSSFVNSEQIVVNAGVDLYNHQGTTDTLNTTIINVNPNFIGRSDKWKASLGVNFFASASEGTTNYYFMPQLDFHYDIYQQIIIPYIGITGGLMHNSYRSLTNANPFVRTLENVLARNTIEKIHLFSGLRGSLSSNTAYNVSFHYSKFDDLAFFVNNRSEIFENKFDVIYDNGVVIRVKGEVQYDIKKFLFRAAGEWRNFTLENEERPWHTPVLQMDFTAKYNLKNELAARMDVIVLGKQFAPEGPMINILPVQLKGITDINLGLEYSYTKYLSAFISLNNLASTRYYRWNNYPTHKFNILGGLTYSF